MDVFIELILAALLIGLNGFFVASEYAMVRLRSTQLDDLIKAGNSDAKLVKEILRNLPAYMSATQIGVTLSSLALGWLGEPAMATLISPIFAFLPLSESVIYSISFAIGFFILISLQVVIGEQLPKSISINFELKVALLVARPLNVFYRIFSPLIWFLNKLVTGVQKVFRLPQAKGISGHTREELQAVIEESAKQGHVEKSESEMIESLFGFRETTAKEIMVHRSDVIAINLDDEPREIMRIIQSEGFSRLPVYRNSMDEITGVLYVKNLLSDAAQLERLSAPSQKNEKEFFSVLLRAVRPAKFVSETQKLPSLLLSFQHSHSQIGIVVSEHGGVEGIVTMENILEELVGDIHDESDGVEERDAVEVDHKLYVDGMLSVSDFNERFAEKFAPIQESTDYQTISGYLQKIAGKIPNIGETFIAAGLHLTVTRKASHKLQQIRIERQ